MSKITNINFGSEVKSSYQDFNLGPDFFNKNSINVGKLNTEILSGDFSTSLETTNPFSVSSAYSYDGPQLVTAKSDSSSSSRPYIWKYQ